jgi:hypothetical protein
MDDAKRENAIATLTGQLLTLDKGLADLRASVTVLKGILAIQLNPDDPIDGAKQIRSLEDEVLKFDPNASARRQAADVIEAVKLWKKHGGPHES